MSTPDKNSDKHLLLDLPIKPHEQRAINFLVNEYLLANSYKLTAITFSDEVENQDFEDWQDVGLNIPKPPELHQIYREFMKCTGYDKPPTSDMGVQTDDYETDREVELNKIVSEMSEEMDRLKLHTNSLEQEKSSLQDMITNSNLASNNAEVCSLTLAYFNFIYVIIILLTSTKNSKEARERFRHSIRARRRPISLRC